MNKQTHVIGGILLIAGTSIGGGMLALPVLTSVTGFVPSLVVYLLCWLFMASTGLLFLEVSQWMHQDANIVTMAQKTLGLSGKLFSWILYLFLFYSLTIAYTVGLGSIVVEYSGGYLSDWMGPVIFIILFSPLILIQTTLAGKLNMGLMVGLIVSYVAFVALGFRFVKPELLTHYDWSKASRALPIAFTAFAYQGTVPTLITYMNYNIAKVRTSIIIGSFLPFIAYAIWQWLILGIVPLEGPEGLAEALQKGQNAVQPLKHFIKNSSVVIIGSSFAFFALITSFLGVSLGLRDFLSDSLRIKQTTSGKCLIAMIIFIPALAIAIVYPNIFLMALEMAGGLGCALLLGLLPILMVWRGRYELQMQGKPQLFGGKFVLLLLGIFVVLEVTLELKRIFF